MSYVLKRKDITTNVNISREELEALAVGVVCACFYYDLIDTLRETPDAELLHIIDGSYCKSCF